MIRWEYVVKDVTEVGYEEAANALGAEGWECFLFEEGFAFFKRPYKLCSECNTKVAVTVSHCSNCGAPVD